MKITKIKNRVLKESVNQLLEGTGNFYYENVCLLVTDEDYETGNYPAYESRPINGNNNFPQYPLEDWNDDLRFWQIVMTPGYYEHACIDYVEVDCDDIYNDIVYDAEHNIDNYAFKDGKWTYEDVFMRHRGEDPEEHPEEDVIKAVREWVFSDYPIITDDDIKQALERHKKDGYYAPSVFLCDSSIINKIEQQLRDKEAEICEQRINEIAKEYGFRKLGTVARFSNGETIYDYIDESLNEGVFDMFKKKPYLVVDERHDNKILSKHSTKEEAQEAAEKAGGIWRSVYVHTADSLKKRIDSKNKEKQKKVIGWGLRDLRDGRFVYEFDTEDEARNHFKKLADSQKMRFSVDPIFESIQIKEGTSEKVYATALKNGQPLNNTELNALISDKVDEWIAAGRITANTSFNDIEKMFRDEVSKTANDIFVVKTFDIIKKRYLDGVKG